MNLHGKMSSPYILMVWMDDEIFSPNNIICLYDYRDEFACGGGRLVYTQR
ncbi:hypothetical protein VCHA50P415_70027 [Vibrio chagasii]|nr:hypothetical protein VCHA27O13_70125 [Vibrio chagasii]CAH6796326.1 hypothetical protein VCHA35O141_100110 [Vibrio chagasii]CAH6796879.1 hypothetical protein VCHA35O135_100028 [Vibrio chagasii]CAH6810647.1 hypothetical protein VCHA32O87_120100 [Vibrio chagasii]CAH6810925.1 hypothetical protein VCHA34P117_120125 [Vibrio chagasii]